MILVKNTKYSSHSLSIVFLVLAAIFSQPILAASTDNKPASIETKPATQTQFLPLSDYVAVLGKDKTKAMAALNRIETFADDASTALLIEMIYLVPNREPLKRVITLIEKKFGRAFNGDVNALYEWLWSVKRPVHPDYAEFKKLIYSPIDARFSEYFSNQPKTLIRLDEVRWGGVVRDGIPPLKNPKMISAADATWLKDEHVVFGVAINGDVRAYPKRILAWH